MNLVDTNGANSGEGNYFDTAQYNQDSPGGVVQTELSGGGLAHLHPFATVLFCRFEGYAK